MSQQHVCTRGPCGCIWATNLCERAQSHWLFVSGTPPGGENCKSQPGPAWSAERERPCFLHSSPVDRMDSSSLGRWFTEFTETKQTIKRKPKLHSDSSCPAFTLCDFMYSFYHFIHPFIQQRSLHTSTTTSKSVPNTGLACLIDSCSCPGSSISLVGSLTRRPAFSYTSLSFLEPVEKMLVHYN